MRRRHVLKGRLAEVEWRGDVGLLGETEVGVVATVNGELSVLRVGQVGAVRVPLGEGEGEGVWRLGFE